MNSVQDHTRVQRIDVLPAIKMKQSWADSIKTLSILFLINLPQTMSRMLRPREVDSGADSEVCWD